MTSRRWCRPSGAAGRLLSVLTTNQKGLIAENAVIRDCILLGVSVARPLDDERYDLILDLGSQLFRVQCKYARRIGNVVVVRCRRCRRGASGFIHRRYAPGEIDAIAAFCPDTESCYLLPYEISVSQAAVYLRLDRTLNNQVTGIRWAKDYEFAARLEALQGP